MFFSLFIFLKKISLFSDFTVSLKALCPLNDSLLGPICQEPFAFPGWEGNPSKAPRRPLPLSWVGPTSQSLHHWEGLKLYSEFPPSMSNVVLMEPCFLGKVLTTLSTGKGTSGGAGLMYLAMPPQRSSLPEGLATVRTREGGLGSGGCTRRGGPGCWTMAALVDDQGLGGGEGTGAGEADEESPLQFLGHEVRRVLPLHVTLLELGIGEGDEAAGALRGP